MLEKGALGLRYLIKYLENGRKENFLVAMDCLDEIKLASIIIIFVNNSDYFGADIPDNTSNPSLFGRVSDFLMGREANCGLSRLLSVR